MSNKLKILFNFIISIVFLSNSAIALAQITAVNNGVEWLKSNQNPDYSWGHITASWLTRCVDTTEVICTLTNLNVKDAIYNNALFWVSSIISDNNYTAARKLICLSNSEISFMHEINNILNSQNLDGGWGGDAKSASMIIDTALALQALKAVKHSDQNVINSAHAYILSTQNPDGGFGFYHGDASNVYMTAIVSTTLQQFSRTTSIATAINKATSYLISHQNSDGGFGTSPSTVYEAALAYIALIGVTTDHTVLGNAISYLKSTQSADGSWNQDPYSTALALRALYLSANKPTPLPSPKNGTVTGKVVDASTNQPLNGVSVQVLGIGNQGLALTDSTGSFILSNIPQGSQAITFFLSGYATATSTVTIVAGSIVNLGTTPLSANPTTGIIKGTVTDAGNGLPLEGVAITVAGSFNGTFITGIDGGFIFSNVSPGNVTINASKTGYYSVTGTGMVAAGEVLFFNPQLSIWPPTHTAGSLKGKVFDGATNKPIEGATIWVTGVPSSTSNSHGVFLANEIAPGTYLVTISAAGYTNQNYQTIIIAGVTTDMQTIYLSPSQQTTTITGKVTDAASGNPIAGADVTVAGIGLSTKTDSNGTYVIAGITSLEFNLKASAVGYDSLVHIVSFIGHSIYAIDFPLISNQSDLKIVSFITDKQRYSAYAPVSIIFEVLNSSIATISGAVSISILNSRGEVVDNLQATTIDANGVVQSQFDFQPGISSTIIVS